MRLPHFIRSALATLAVASWAAGAPVQLTRGPGNDTEAAWSPDGTRLAFQSDRGGELGVYVLDLGTSEVKPLVVGPGHACFPAWSPDGKLVAYAHARFTSTAAQGLENGYNLFVVPAAGGEPRRLTGGLARDYAPAFTADGKQLLFSSTRGARENSVGLFRMPTAGGDPEPVLVQDSADVAHVQPALSPDGRHLAFGYIAGFRSNWSIRLAKAADPADAFPLTDPAAPFYGPRWSPDGALVACTGYQPGDLGWGVYLLETATGRRVRLDAGEGNARSPAWSPDGKELVFEGNAGGFYKLYRMAVPAASLPPLPEEEGEAGPPVVRLSFVDPPETMVADLSGAGNDGKVEGELAWADGGATFGTGGYVTIPNAKGCDFGTGPFSVRIVLQVAKHTDQLRLITVADYPDNRLGWQVFLQENNHVCFNARDSLKQFLGAFSDAPLPVGRKVTLVGVRRANGRVELYVDGRKQNQSASGAFYAYPVPNQLRIGTQFDGNAPFPGTVYAFEVYRRALTRKEIGCETLQEFLAR